MTEPAPPREGKYVFPDDTNELFRGKALRWIENPVRFRANDLLEVIAGLTNTSISLRALIIAQPAFFVAHTETHRFYGQGNQPALVLSVDATLAFIGMLTNATVQAFRRTTLAQFETTIRGTMVPMPAPVPTFRARINVIRTRVAAPHDEVTFANVNAAALSVVAEAGYSAVHTRVRAAKAIETGEAFAGFTWRNAPAEETHRRRVVSLCGGVVVPAEAAGTVGATGVATAAEPTEVEVAEPELEEDAEPDAEPDAEVAEPDPEIQDAELEVEDAELEAEIQGAELDVEEPAETEVEDAELEAEEPAEIEVPVNVAHNIVDVLNGYMSGDKKGRKTTDTTPKVSVYDLIEVVMEQPDCGRKTFFRLKNDHPEVGALCPNFKFPGRGQKDTPVTDARGLVTILNLLPGRAAAAFRAASADVIVRFLGGDDTLIAEIKRNEIQGAAPAKIEAEIEAEEPAETEVEDAELKAEEPAETEVNVAHNIVDVLNGYMIGDKKVRKTTDTPPKVSVIDLITVVTEQSADAASKVFRRMTLEHPGVRTGCPDFKFPGPGQRLTPVTDARGLVTILNLLPGRAAAAFRAASADVIVRFLGGDDTLIAEIKRNAEAQQQLPADAPTRIFGEDVQARSVQETRTMLRSGELTASDIIKGLGICSEDEEIAMELVEGQKHMVTSPFMESHVMYLCLTTIKLPGMPYTA